MDEPDSISQLCDYIPVPLWITADGRFIDCNAAAVAFFGCPDRDALIGRQPDDFTPEYQSDGERSATKARRLIEAASGRTQPLSFEWTHLRHDGSLIDTVVNLRWIMLDSQPVLLCAGYDLSARKATERAQAEREADLRRQLRRQTELIWSTDAGTWEWDRRSGIMQCNARWAEILGYRLDELPPADLQTWRLRLLHPDDRLQSDAPLDPDAIRGQDVHEHCARMRHKDGHWIWMLTRGRVVERDEEGRALRMSGTLQDISDKVQARTALQLMGSVFEHTREGIIITDAAGLIVDVNTAFTRITGYTRTEVLGRTPRVLQSGRHGPEYFAAMWAALAEKGQWSGEICNHHKDGRLQTCMMNISAIRDGRDQVTHYLALFSDITSIKAYQQHLERLAHHDLLTGLPNRVLLADRLQQAMVQTLRRGKLLAVVYMDLDGFKAINDTHGHEAGDEVLIALARKLKAVLREGDTLARVGGDEFVALLVDLESVADCEPVLQRLLQAAATPVVLSTGAAVQVSASAGLTFYPQDFAEAEQLLRHADQAMYRVKQSGRNGFRHFRPPHDETTGGDKEAAPLLR